MQDLLAFQALLRKEDELMKYTRSSAPARVNRATDVFNGHANVNSSASQHTAIGQHSNTDADNLPSNSPGIRCSNTAANETCHHLQVSSDYGAQRSNSSIQEKKEDCRRRELNSSWSWTLLKDVGDGSGSSQEDPCDNDTPSTTKKSKNHRLDDSKQKESKAHRLDKKPSFSLAKKK
eukprot:scaffold3032_cov342-Alexandrium_tamarense.AAC.1